MRASLALLTVALLSAHLPAAPVDYLRDVKPILTKHCFGCHGPDKQRSGPRLDTARAIFQGGNSGSIVVTGQSAASRLGHAITGSNDVSIMPPKPPRPADRQT